MIKLALLAIILAFTVLLNSFLLRFPAEFPKLPTMPSEKPESIANEKYYLHENITTTIFWVGEKASSANGHISNAQSAWDENWLQNFGGTDTPNQRVDYRPAGFVPSENSFYVALPYNDIDENSNRKATASTCLNSADLSLTNHSWCKNTWIAIFTPNALAYAQWQDVGPYEEDDFDYVFGRSSSKNIEGVKAGLDVSPAVADYLGLGDVSKTAWRFVDANRVPEGPWKTTITSSLGDSL